MHCNHEKLRNCREFTRFPVPLWQHPSYSRAGIARVFPNMSEGLPSEAVLNWQIAFVNFKEVRMCGQCIVWCCTLRLEYTRVIEFQLPTWMQILVFRSSRHGKHLPTFGSCSDVVSTQFIAQWHPPLWSFLLTSYGWLLLRVAPPARSMHQRRNLPG
jgi:hypothetical protein